MARPLRIEFQNAIYHVTSRGNRQTPIFPTDADRHLLLAIVDHAMARLDAVALAFCLMGNHFHFVVRTRQANLSRLMRQINGEYTRAFNHRHALTGHLLQGRFHAILVDRDAYLVEVCRYVELNPVRAGLVDQASDWPWSSHRAHVGLSPGWKWLATSELHGHLLGRDADTPEDRRQAAQAWADTVASGLGADLWKTSLRREIFLGDDTFIDDMQARASEERLRCPEIPQGQRATARPLSDWISPERSREEAFRLAYTRGALTMMEIARQAGLSVSSVSRLIASAERLQDSRPDTAVFKT